MPVHTNFNISFIFASERLFNSPKADNLVLMGPEGNSLGELAEEPTHNVNRMSWTLRVSSNHQKSSDRCHCGSCCCCCFGGDSIASWFRPMAIIFLFDMIAHIVTISIVAAFISQGQHSGGGLLTEVMMLTGDEKLRWFHFT